jgi:hypothetical protein
MRATPPARHLILVDQGLIIAEKVDEAIETDISYNSCCPDAGQL